MLIVSVIYMCGLCSMWWFCGSSSSVMNFIMIILMKW